MPETTLADLEKLFLALSDKTRMRLLTLMVDGETSVSFLADSLGESQPKISRHLAYLRNAGVVSTRRDGKWIYYQIEPQLDPSIARVLNETLRSIMADIRDTPEPSASYEPIETSEKVDIEEEVSPETYEDDWAPEEMEVFLL